MAADKHGGHESAEAEAAHDVIERDDSIKEIKDTIDESRTLLGSALNKLDRAAERLQRHGDAPFSDLERN